MRHGNKINHLGRKQAHRKALLMNLSIALIKHKRITTTLAKAKELRKHIEPLINKTKVDTTHNRRTLFSYLQDKESINELFNVIAEKVADRPGGYTRIIKLGFRKGDAADIAMIELVDFNDVYVKEAKADSGKTRRSRAKKSGSESTAQAVMAPTDLVEEVVATEVEDVTEVAEVAVEETQAVVEETAVATEETAEAVVEEVTDLEKTEEKVD
jgi:large subunit ribosomal protein L17